MVSKYPTRNVYMSPTWKSPHFTDNKYMYMYRYEDITTLDIVQDISVPFKDPFLGQQATVKSFSSHSKLSPSNCGKISCSHCRKASWSFSANLGESRTQTSRDLTHFWGPTNWHVKENYSKHLPNEIYLWNESIVHSFYCQFIDLEWSAISSHPFAPDSARLAPSWDDQIHSMSEWSISSSLREECQVTGSSVCATSLTF